MAPNGYLFVNKHSNSPSLSRNTGSEASLASKVNKHVQQQRFWKSSGPRQNWYRPFVRSESSGPSSPGSQASCLEDNNEHGSPRRSIERCPSSPRRSNSSRRSSKVLSNTRPRSVTMKKESQSQAESSTRASDAALALLGDSNGVDPFGNTVVEVTPTLREVLERHFKWMVSSSVSDFTIRDGVKRVFDSVLTNRMHSTAFLAMATAQQRKTGKLVLPPNHSPEFYSYRATKLIREYIESSTDGIDPYTFVDIFRLAMCEWISGNTKAARIHFAYIAQNYEGFTPRSDVDLHSLESISSEDIFLAIDVDERPLLALTWEPDLPAGPYPATPSAHATKSHADPDSHGIAATLVSQISAHPSKYSSGSPRPTSPTKNHYQTHGTKLLAVAPALVKPILQKCLTSLKSFPSFPQIDFGSATAGPIWTMKRRIHAGLHRLQSLDAAAPSIDACVHRTLVILLFLASTTPRRREGRTDVPRLAARLKRAMEDVERPQPSTTGRSTTWTSSASNEDPGLWLWMLVTGLAAAREEVVGGRSDEQQRLVTWFEKRARMLLMQVCQADVTVSEVEAVLGEYLTFRTVHRIVAEDLVGAVRRKASGGVERGAGGGGGGKFSSWQVDGYV